MNISCIKVGYLKCNCYLLEKDSNCLLIDPGDEVDKILKFINGKNIIGILITHSHFDHVGCVSYLVSEFNYPVYDINNLVIGNNKIGNFSFEVISCFGHTKDSISFYFKDDKVMFTGDFLFKGTVGRCDFPFSDYNLMMKSIDNILKYDDDIVIYPGHGDTSVLGVEKVTNPYLVKDM